MIEREDFEMWLDLPITAHLFKMFAARADEAEADWMRHSWEGGKADPMLLAELRGRAAEIYRIVNTSYEDIDDSHEAKDSAKG